jgi:hypothetical protein
LTRREVVIATGRNAIRGLETELKGYLNDAWQSWLGYAYTDARVASATSATILPGNRIQLVPLSLPRSVPTVVGQLPKRLMRTAAGHNAARGKGVAKVQPLGGIA